MEAMFQLCQNIQFKDMKNFFDKLNLDNSLTSIRAMFCKCTKLLFEPEMDKWFFKLPNDTQLQNMSMLFSGCKGLTKIIWPNWKNVKFDRLKDISYMFNRCTELKSVGYFRYFNTSKVNNMCGLFNGCTALKTIDGGKNNDIYLYTKSALDISIMFQGCKSLVKIDNSQCDAKVLENVSGLFADCKSLTTFKNFIYYTETINDMTAMFRNCESLTSLPDHMKNWKWEKVGKAKEMFSGCKNLNAAPKWFSSIKFALNRGDIDDLLKNCSFGNIEKIKGDFNNNSIGQNQNEIKLNK
jgi:hypothetical protein